jgi:hypothetical protein
MYTLKFTHSPRTYEKDTACIGYYLLLKTATYVVTLKIMVEEVIVIDQSKLSFTVKMALYAVNKTDHQWGQCLHVDKPTPRSIQVNRKKLSKRKNPSVEFRLIKIDGHKPPELPSLPQGTHASPRQHWRRGHWRHLSFR